MVLNLISSPGSGKTSLLERTIARLKDLQLDSMKLESLVIAHQP